MRARTERRTENTRSEPDNPGTGAKKPLRHPSYCRANRGRLWSAEPGEVNFLLIERRLWRVSPGDVPSAGQSAGHEPGEKCAVCPK